MAVAFSPAQRADGGISCVRVEEDVTALNPHRPGRAQLTHPVPHNTTFAVSLSIDDRSWHGEVGTSLALWNRTSRT